MLMRTLSTGFARTERNNGGERGRGDAMNIRIILIVGALGMASPAASQMNLYAFKTTAEFVSQCDVASPPFDCLDAISHVEGVVDDSDNPNGTCDGGPDAMLKLHSNDELTAWLTARLVRLLPWLKAHPEYNEMSYGDGVWAALKGVYC